MIRKIKTNSLHVQKEALSNETHTYTDTGHSSYDRLTVALPTIDIICYGFLVFYWDGVHHMV